MNAYPELSLLFDEDRLTLTGNTFLATRQRKWHSSGQRFLTEMLSGFSEGEATLFLEWLQRVARNMGDTYHTPR